MSLLITDATVLAPDGPLSPGWLAAEAGHITAMGSGDPPAGHTHADDVVDAGGATLAPGFVDVHVHGAVGHETMDADPDGIRRMAAFYASHGVTAFCPTTWTASREDTLAAVDAVAAAMATPGPGARILGVHLEGPFLSPERCGAQAPEHIRPADLDELTAWLDTGVVRLITLAPELAANREAIAVCRARGVTVSAGHTDATYEQARDAIELGIDHATHLFNAMSPLHHRTPGTVGAALSDPRVRCELIADGVHVHPGAMTVAWRAKGPDGLCLVTDALRAAGLPEGTYRFDERAVTHRDGAMWLDSGALAGSGLTMDRALRNFLSSTGASLAEAWPVASRTPARAAGAAGQTGELRVGARADLVLLDARLEVIRTVVGGATVEPPAPRPESVPS